MKKGKTKNKYAMGGPIQTPQQAMGNFQTMMNRVETETANDRTVNTLQTIGNIGIGVGSQLVGSGKGMKGKVPGTTPVDSDINPMLAMGINPKFNASQALPSNFAMGGLVGAEVEGGEMGQLPDGTMLDFMGPTHEQGGIPLNLPEGTAIYSDRVSIDGETMADRKEKREKKLKRYQKKAEKGDTVARETLMRYMMSYEQEEEMDMIIQQILNQKENPQQFASGGWVRNTGLPAVQGFIGNNPGLVGDTMGMWGNWQQGRAAQRAVDSARAATTPNINAFERFGQDAIDTNIGMEAAIRQGSDLQRRQLESSRQATTKRNRQSARGINTMRGLDLASNAQAGRLGMEIVQNELSAINNVRNQRGQLQNQRDSTRMQGEQARDLADRQDTMNLISRQFQADTRKAEALVRTGRALNQQRQNQVGMNALNQTFSDFLFKNNRVTGRT